MSERENRIPRGRQWLFALLPAVALLASAEVCTRVLLVAEPSLRSLPLAPEAAGLFRPDPDLFWSLLPEIDLPFMGQRVVTNSLGLRSPEPGPRPRSGAEYRILSMGESSTFGSGVAGSETYTARLADDLQAAGWAPRVTAINAGVPAYSSFQSVKYLELRGLALEPDLLLFYHEVNDYLPSSVRDSSNNEVGVLQTDWERWESQRGGGLAWLTRSSALLDFLRMKVALARVARFDAVGFENPVAEIGLPGIGIPPRLVRVDGERPRRLGLDESALGTRVSSSERLELLERLSEIARDHDIELLVIHPAYRDSVPHACVLTEFASAAGVPWVEAGLALHPPGEPRGALFRDSWHPVAEGHARLARLIAEEIQRVFR